MQPLFYPFEFVQDTKRGHLKSGSSVGYVGNASFLKCARRVSKQNLQWSLVALIYCSCMIGIIICKDISCKDKMIRSFKRSFSTLLSISPIDGRYANASAPLSPYFSESALMKYRIIVESQWLIHLLQAGILPIQKNTSIESISNQLNKLINEFDGNGATRIKQIEKVTNHDLKSVEYFMKENMTAYKEDVHFCCTSEDINNLSYALMLKDSLNNVILPKLSSLTKAIIDKSENWAAHSMLAHTHGQPATPTTLGKEFANFAYRLDQQIGNIKAVQINGKMNGAVGNYNAHYFAYPNQPWRQVCESFVEKKLKLKFNPYTTQIEPHDSLARVLGQVGHSNTVLIGLCRDSWEYISKGYLKQRAIAGEVGSSTMPHKVNPIDFQNCEGNLGVANSLIDHFRSKLPISRQQRDLSDSTVLRNQGSALAYSLIGYESLLKGLSKVDSNIILMKEELSSHFQVITQAIQTQLRKVGYPQPYELLKELSRGKAFTAESKRQLIAKLKGKIGEDSIKKIQQLTPGNYLGEAEQLAKQVKSKCGNI